MHTLTNERLNKIASWRKTYGDAHNVMIPAHEAEELVSRLLAAEAQLAELRGQEPIYQIQDQDGWVDVTTAEYDHAKIGKMGVLARRVVFAHPAPPAASQHVPDENGLLPCPFCGGNAGFDYDDSCYEWISCNKCGVSTDTAIHTETDAKDELRKMWNTRAAAPQHKGSR